MRLIGYTAVFAAAVFLCRDATIARRVLWAIMITAVCAIAYGLVMHAQNRSCVAMGYIKVPLELNRPCTFSGPFVNSGNFATLVGMSGLCALAIISVGRRRSADRDWRARWRERLANLTGGRALAFGVLLGALIAILLTVSRAGLAAFLFASLALVVVPALLRRRTRRLSYGLLASALAVIVTAVGVFGGDMVVRYFALVEAGDRTRSELLTLALAAIQQRPWIGWGLGSYSEVYSLLQPVAINIRYDKAHNTYLEWAMDLGVPAAALATSVFVMIAVRCARGVAERARDSELPAIGLAATLFIGAQSLVDFGVQIPAVAFTYSALAGIGWAQSFSSRSG